MASTVEANNVETAHEQHVASDFAQQESTELASSGDLRPGYIRTVLKRLAPELHARLDHDEWIEVLRTAEAARKPLRHWIDWRFVVPLGFRRIYGVIQFGPDRRKRVNPEDDRANRRHTTSVTWSVMQFLAATAALGLLLVAFMVVIVFLSYMMKEMLNIDINPGWSMLRDKEVF